MGIDATLGDREIRDAVSPETLPDRVLTVPLGRVKDSEDVEPPEDSVFPGGLVALVKTMYAFADDNDLARYLRPEYPEMTYGQKVKAVLNSHTRIEKVDRNLCYDIDHHVPTFLPESLKGKDTINALVECNRLYFTDKDGQEDEYYNPELVSGVVIVLYVAKYFSGEANPTLQRMGQDIFQQKRYQHVLRKIFPEPESGDSN